MSKEQLSIIQQIQDKINSTSLHEIIYLTKYHIEERSGVPPHVLIHDAIVLGADVNGKGKSGLTPIYLAIIYCDREHVAESIIRVLLEHGANPNISTTTGDLPLVQAILLDQHHVMRLLVEHGASIKKAHAVLEDLYGFEIELEELKSRINTIILY